ncbi:LPS-assembly protein LptD [Marinomonas sp. M1K-6]|uniref:LPS-assembly protein LptD n=1 Tax=Marinomonas profundi TaxID=2726122 RepID=A0A847R1H6_9GAMM|nr:LPS assembly protein LptD [Marinomonas profundi]NLQ17601.1 LPS-assembly protein LptD [Marinomonas profundi]UDV02182.1 LPS-assembly protein LptD [Marinomonas profundi]
MAKHLRTYALFFHSLFIVPFAQAQVDQWDWAPRESLTSEQQSQLNQYCQGSYVSSWQATNATSTNLAADLIVRDKNGVIHLQGAAEVIQPQSTLSADSIEGIPNEYYRATGNVTLRSENQLIRSSNGYIANNDTAPTEFNQAKFLSHQSGARGEAALLSRRQDGVVFIEEGFFTTCEPNEESWKLYGSAIKLDTKSGFGTAKHVQIRIADLPVFYFPWLRFPLNNTRQTGFLFPSFGYSGTDGLSFSAPFYWNIAPNYDATITPQFIQEKGAGVDIEFRHLSPYGETIYEQSSFSDNDEGEQTLLKLTTAQSFNRYVSAGFLLEDNPTSDKYPEANSTSIGEKDHYQRSVYINVNSGNFLNKVTYLTYQTPDRAIDQPFEWLPRIDSSYRLATSLLDYRIDVQYTDFYDPAEDNFDGQRIALNQDVSLNFSNAWGSLTPGVLTQYRDYNLHDYTTDADHAASVGNLSGYLDSSLVLERRVDINKGVWRQTLEPRLNYLYVPYEDQDAIPDFDASHSTMTYSQAFSHKRFNGNDRIGDTEQVSFGLESRLYDENNNERWAFKAGQVFYLADRYVGISGDTDDNSAIDNAKRSDLLTSANYNGNRYSLTGNVNYNLDNDEVNLAQLVTTLEPVDDVKINLSYLYSINNIDPDDDAKQASIGSIFPLNQNWSMFTQYTYDFLREDASKEIAGFGYENCCIKVSLSYQHWLNDDNEFDRGVFLQFILRSLSTAGRASNAANIADSYWNQGKVGY